MRSSRAASVFSAFRLGKKVGCIASGAPPAAAEAERAGPAGPAHSQQCGHPLAGGSPAASVAVQRMGGPAAGAQAVDSGLAYEYDPDYIERK